MVPAQRSLPEPLPAQRSLQWPRSPPLQGRQKVEAHRTQLQSVMRDIVDELTDDELDQLVAASEIMGRLIDTVQVRKATA